MPTYDLEVTVTYNYEVEADTWEEAEQMGWEYEDYGYAAEVYSIDVTEQDPEEEEVE